MKEIELLINLIVISEEVLQVKGHTHLTFNYACKYTVGTTACTIHVSGSHLSVWCTLKYVIEL